MFITINAFSQNIQLHYDMHNDRNIMTSTIEMFKPDKLGNTFFFVDMDYGVKNWNNQKAIGLNMAYWEIARVFKHPKIPVGLHTEFDAGMGRTPTNFGFRINEALLGGVDYSWNAQNFSKGFSIKALYKFIAGKHDLSYQLTGVWYMNLIYNKISFSGFFDFWREDSDFNFDGTADAKFIFLSEPQLWYNITEHFSAGGEVELGYNFANLKGFKAYPTIALKYKF